MTDLESKDPLLEELQHLIERLRKREDYKGSLQISTCSVHGESTHMITASGNVDSQKRLHIELDQSFKEFASEEQRTKMTQSTQDSISRTLRSLSIPLSVIS